MNARGAGSVSALRCALKRFGPQIESEELPSLVSAAPELPSVLQKLLDARKRNTHVVFAGSSQRMTHGLVLDGAAALFGRAHELLKVTPLPIGWLKQGLGVVGAELLKAGLD